MDTTPDREILERILKLEQENYRILKALRSSQRWGVFWGFVKFLLFVVLPLVLAYVYLQPYLEMIWATYQQAQGQLNSLQQLGGQIPDISGLIKQYQQARPQ
ncbi:MAG TPA: hypothetical protein VD967_03145 [Candidatus Paceibacterota bacterium]|nr:hypothetical protein [Candidatus Paceibacterota bacterium]